MKTMENSDIVSKMVEANELASNPDAVKELKKYKQVPVLYIPHKELLKHLPDPGLGVLIENAMSVQEVNNLLTKGKLDYKNARSKTIKKWERIADKRIKELLNK